MIMLLCGGFSPESFVKPENLFEALRGRLLCGSYRLPASSPRFFLLFLPTGQVRSQLI